MPFLVIGNLLATVLLVVCLSAVPANNLGLLYIGTSCCGGRIAHIVQRIENYFAINFQLSVRQCAWLFLMGAVDFSSSVPSDSKGNIDFLVGR